jgi:hypothetical protein
MSDGAAELMPADPRDVETCFSLGLKSGSRLARHQAAEVIAKVVAERLVAELERSGFVIMGKPIPVGDRKPTPALLRCARQPANPSPANPRSIIAQVEG